MFFSYSPLRSAIALMDKINLAMVQRHKFIADRFNGTTAPPFLPSSAAAMRPPMYSEARRSGSLSRWASRWWLMPEYGPQLTYDWQPEAAACTETRICMPKVVKPDASKSSAFPDRLPWALYQRVAFRDRHLARHRGRAIEAGQYRESRSIQDNGFFARLGVGEKQEPAFQVHLIPSEAQISRRRQPVNSNTGSPPLQRVQSL